MRLLLNIRTDESGAAFLAKAVAGLAPTNDAGEEIVAALLEVLDGRRVSAPRREAPTRPDSADVAEAHRALGGSVAATARALGLARSTVRAHLERAAAPANDNAEGARRTG